MRGRTVAELLVVYLASIAVAAPVAFVTTILLMPFWSWLERTTGIESIGHSGPATWCFVTVFAVLAFAAISLIAFRSRRSRPG